MYPFLIPIINFAKKIFKGLCSIPKVIGNGLIFSNCCNDVGSLQNTASYQRNKKNTDSKK